MSAQYQNMLPHLIHLGALLYLVCFLFRDQILLRTFAILGDVAYTSYYFVAAERPLWEAIAWSTLNMLVNFYMITLVLRDRRMLPLSDDELSLYQNLKGLTPGQFRNLMKHAYWATAETPMLLTAEGQDLSALHFVLSGGVDIEKSGRTFSVEEPLFIGELAYLRKKPATASVYAKAGARLVSWNHAALHDLTRKDEALQAALTQILNADLAEKLARS